MKIMRFLTIVTLILACLEPAGARDIAADLGLRAAEAPVSEDPAWGPDGPIVVRVFTPAQLERLEAVAGDAILIGVTNEDEALEYMADATALIGLCDRKLVKAAPKLHWIQIFSAGVDRCVDELSGASPGLLLTNMQRVSGPEIAEHVMGMLLGLTRGLVEYIRNQHTGEWAQDLVPMSKRPELGGRTMLIVGLGGIGTAVGQRAAGFDMRIIAVRASGRPGPEFVSEVGTPDRLLEMAAEADVVVNSAPLTPDTEDMFDADFFAALKPGAYFINVGRGRSVVTGALVAALETGRLAGAGLDVTEPEPLPPDHPLWQMPNVIVTPHVSAGSDRVRQRVAAVVRENLRRYVNGEPMLSVVNIDRGY